jgi:hypothetical protein
LITKGFQVSEHLVDPQMEEAIHIFTKEPSGPENGETADHFRPEIAVIVLSLSLPSHAEGLARKSSADEIDGLDELPVDGSDVVVTRDFRPVLLEDSSTVLINFDLPRDFKTSSFKSKIESADTGKQ